jgi:pyroglutamyl-peptidase
MTEVLKIIVPKPPLHLLRQIPVDFELAPAQVIAHVQSLQPDWIICCGMAESRQHLSLEVQATCGAETLQTKARLNDYVQSLRCTELSHDAGQFVCNHLYYAVLRYLNDRNLKSHCIFVHVPILTPANLGVILVDFLALLHQIGMPESL